MLVGHVKHYDFVILDGLTKESFRVNIQELYRVAHEMDVSPILLGCETARINGVAGTINTVNSLDIAEQLHRALGSSSYLDFFAELGKPESPFVATAAVIEKAEVLFAERMGTVASGGVERVIVSPELARSQATFAQADHPKRIERGRQFNSLDSLDCPMCFLRTSHGDTPSVAEAWQNNPMRLSPLLL